MGMFECVQIVLISRDMAGDEIQSELCVPKNHYFNIYAVYNASASNYFQTSEIKLARIGTIAAVDLVPKLLS